MLCLHWLLPGNGFHCRFLSFCVPWRQSLPAGTYLTTQLGVTWLVFYQGLFLTPLWLTDSHPNIWLKTVLPCPWPSQGPGPPFSDWLVMAAGPRYIASGRTAQKTPFHAAAMLYRDIAIAADCIENITSNSSSIVAYVSVAAFTWCLLSHCLAAGVLAEPFPTNGCLCWLHNSGFQQTCPQYYWDEAQS
jgi:hypothetical protein